MCWPGFTGIQAKLLLPKNAQVSFRPFSCKYEICILSIYQVSEWYCHYWLYAMGKAKKDFRVHLGVVCTSFLSYKTIIFGLVLFAFHTEAHPVATCLHFHPRKWFDRWQGWNASFAGAPHPFLMTRSRCRNQCNHRVHHPTSFSCLLLVLTHDFRLSNFIIQLRGTNLLWCVAWRYCFL